MSTWEISEYLEWVACGCPVNTEVDELDLSSSMLTNIVDEIVNLTNLRRFYLYDNSIATLPDSIGDLSALEELDASHNRLVSIPITIGKLENLLELILSTNSLTSIPEEIGHIRKLEMLCIADNELADIPVSIGELASLRILKLCGNTLKSIPFETGNCHMLTTIDLADNQLYSLPNSLGLIQTLRIINISDNPIVNIPANLYVLLDEQIRVRGLYGDSQSVHNSKIQQSIKSSVVRLLKNTMPLSDEEVISGVLDDQVLTVFTKQSIIEYAFDSSELIIDLDLTFMDVLCAVWNRISTNENVYSIKCILNDEMEDSECKCFTGRVSRLVNCLSGMDELVEVTISDNEQIGNIILQVKRQLAIAGQYTVESHRAIAKSQLETMGYKSDDVDPWINCIE